MAKNIITNNAGPVTINSNFRNHATSKHRTRAKINMKASGMDEPESESNFMNKEKYLKLKKSLENTFKTPMAPTLIEYFL